MRHIQILFGCDVTTAVTTEAPQWHLRQRGRIRDEANGLSPPGDSNALFATEVHSFLRGKLNYQSPSAFRASLCIQEFESAYARKAVKF